MQLRESLVMQLRESLVMQLRESLLMQLRESLVMQLRESLVTPSATTRFHTTATHAVPSTTETSEHHFAAVV
jgi:hypothetical protein